MILAALKQAKYVVHQSMFFFLVETKMLNGANNLGLKANSTFFRVI